MMGMRTTKKALALLLAVVMTLALAPTVAFAAPASLTVELPDGITLKAQTPSDDSTFYYTTSASSQAAPGDDVNIDTIAGATAYSADTIVGTPNYVQVYRVNTSGIITGYGEEIRHTLSTGNIYTGTIDVRDNGVSVGTFSYVYTPGLYTNDYIWAGLKEAMSAPYDALAPTVTHAEVKLTDWYANYSTTGDVTVDTTATQNQASWRSVEDITENILSAHFQNASTDSGQMESIEYKISPRNAYDVVVDASGEAGLVKSVATNVEHLAYTVYESTAATVGLGSNARLTVDGQDYVRYGGKGEYTPVDGATYDMLTNTLTLNGYNGGEIDARYMDLNIVLTGTNNLTDENGITVSGGLTISGNGTLTAVISGGWDDATAIYAKDGVDIQGGTLNLTTPSAGCGISGDSITINASAASVTASGEYGLIGKTITITGDADIKEGNDATSAQSVPTITLSDDGGYKLSKPYVSITPGTPSTNASITPTTATFDRYKPADVSVTLDPGSYDLSSIRGGSTALVPGTDYTADGNTYTIKKDYLAMLALGANTITFNMDGGTDPTLTINVIDSFVAVESITGIPSTIDTGATLDLNAAAQVAPNNASVKTITWDITSAGDTGATIAGGKLTVTTPGTITIKATIAGGGASQTTYTKEFTIKALNNYEVIVQPVTWVLGNTGEVFGRIDAPFEKFLRLELKGSVISEDNYTAKDGSTTITFADSYLNTLKADTYTYRAIFTDGYADLTLVVKTAAAVGTDPTKPAAVPATGDSTGMAGITFALIAALAGLVLVVFGYRRGTLVPKRSQARHPRTGYTR